MAGLTQDQLHMKPVLALFKDGILHKLHFVLLVYISIQNQKNKLHEHIPFLRKPLLTFLDHHLLILGLMTAGYKRSVQRN